MLTANVGTANDKVWRGTEDLRRKGLYAIAGRIDSKIKRHQLYILNTVSAGSREGVNVVQLRCQRENQR